MAATAQSSVAANTSKQSGSLSTESPWLTHTWLLSGTPSNSWLAAPAVAVLVVVALVVPTFRSASS